MTASTDATSSAPSTSSSRHSRLSDPSPGGGAAAAVSAALAASLTAMVVRLSLDRPKYAEHRRPARRRRWQPRTRHGCGFLELAEEDADGLRGLSRRAQPAARDRGARGGPRRCHARCREAHRACHWRSSRPATRRSELVDRAGRPHQPLRGQRSGGRRTPARQRRSRRGGQRSRQPRPRSATRATPAPSAPS